MSYKGFDSYSWLVVASLTFLFLLLFGVSGWFFAGSVDFFMVGWSVWCDGLSFYLSLLSVVLWVSLVFFIHRLSVFTVAMILLSVVCSVFSYCCVHAFFFWFFYEMSILPLLLLLVLDSPYSERYLASWYLMGYVVITSLPMLVCLFYFALEQGSFNFYDWQLEGDLSTLLLVLLSILFITKIPLFPFHVWLPIVHAEASSVVSVCLSGYIMKLGILGSFRFCSWILPEYVFSFGFCLFLIFFSLSFFLSAARELDGKRWLALLSLCHIVMPVVCLGVGVFDYSLISFLYCLGHGLSAGATFILLWLMYDVTGSRNWFLVKNCVSGSLVIRVCGALCLCTVASLPPLVQFFSELFIVRVGGIFSVIFIFAILFYLFLGGLVPVFMLGCLLTRHYSISFGLGNIYSGVCSVVFLVVWSFLLFMFI